MAEDKKSIIIYADWITKFEELEDDEAGRLIKHFFRYVNDLNPTAPDRTTKLMFIDIQNQLKRDLKKWEKTLEDRSYNGRLGNIKRWNIDLYNEIVLEKITLEEAENIAKHRKTSLPDINTSPPIANIAVNDNVNVTVNVNDILLKKETKVNIIDRKLVFYNSLIPYTQTYGKVMLREFYEYWTEHGENDLKFRKEKEKTFGLERRLKTWSSNNFNNKTESTKNIPNPAKRKEF